MAKSFLSGLFSVPTAGDAIKGKLLCYDWRVDGLSAEIGVDQRLTVRAPMRSHPVLAYVGFLPWEGQAKPDEKRKAKPSALSASALKKALAFINICTTDLNAVVAGYIETRSELQYYIYLPSVSEYERMKALAAEEKAFECRIGGRTEPDWKSYFEVLLPDEAKNETIHNGEVIAYLYKNGDSDAPRRLNFHLAFPTDAARTAFASNALKDGFATGGLLDGSEAHEDCPFEISVHRICALKKWDVDTVTVHLVRVADEHGGKLLYWDCPMVPRKL